MSQSLTVPGCTPEAGRPARGNPAPTAAGGVRGRGAGAAPSTHIALMSSGSDGIGFPSGLAVAGSHNEMLLPSTCTTRGPVSVEIAQTAVSESSDISGLRSPDGGSHTRT